MSPENRLTIIERKEQEANHTRMMAYRKRRMQILTLEDAIELLAWRELRLGKEDR